MVLGAQALKSHLETTLVENDQAMFIRDFDGDQGEFLGKGSRFFEKFTIPVGDVPYALFQNLIHPDDVDAYDAQMTNVREAYEDAPVSYQVVYRLRDVDGVYHSIKEKGTIVLEEQDNGKSSFVSHGTLQENQIADSTMLALSRGHFAAHKGRRLLCEEIDYLLANRSPISSSGYLLTLGVDRLSLVNEAFGAQVTDELLQVLQVRLKEIVGDAGDIYHLSGDVYGVLFAENHGSEMPSMARHILNHFYENLVQVGEHFIRVSISIGGKVFDVDAEVGSTVISHAERALQMAKDRGRGCFISYSAEKHGSSSSHKMLRIGDEFLRGLNDGRVRMAFQPIVNSGSGDVSFHECLMRLTDEEGNVHAAGTFIPAVEQLGMSRIVDQFCIRQAIQELSLFPDLVLSVNVTNWTLMDNDWLRGLVYILSDRPDVASRLIVEITESVAMVDIRQTLRVVRTLRDLGCRVALDDFGAGATAFVQLKELDLDIVKIDKSFVRHMNEDQNYLFIKTLQSLADGMQLETVGEGAETLDEADILAADGVTYIQGYAYGFPSMDRSWLPKDHVNRSKALHEITGDRSYNFWD